MTMKSNKHDKGCGQQPAENQRVSENPFINDKFARISRTAIDLIGYPDRMLYRSKSMGKPTTIFNANVYNSGAEKIWYGDLEIERDREALIELSSRIGSVYILWEMDGRFLQEMPTIGYIKSHAIVTIECGSIKYNEQFEERVKVLCERMGRAAKMNNEKGC
jgi:hypothetical protein